MYDCVMNRPALLSVWLDSLLSDPMDTHELRDLAAVCFRGGIQATTQAATAPAADPRDLELLTPEEVAREFRCSRWSVRAAIRSKALATWPPGVKRGMRVRRGVGKEWAGR